MSTTEAYLDLHRHAPVAMLDHEITIAARGRARR